MTCEYGRYVAPASASAARQCQHPIAREKATDRWLSWMVSPINLTAQNHRGLCVAKPASNKHRL